MKTSFESVSVHLIGFISVKSLEINLAGQPNSERHRTLILHRFSVLNSVHDLFRKRLLAAFQLPIVEIGHIHRSIAVFLFEFVSVARSNRA